MCLFSITPGSAPDDPFLTQMLDAGPVQLELLMSGQWHTPDWQESGPCAAPAPALIVCICKSLCALVCACLRGGLQARVLHWEGARAMHARAGKRANDDALAWCAVPFAPVESGVQARAA